MLTKPLSAGINVMIALALVTGTSAIAQVAADKSLELKPFEFTQVEMGVEFKARVYACDFEVANNAVKAAFDRIHMLNDVFSDYFAASEVRRLCESSARGRPVSVSEDVRLVLSASLELSRQTDGAFDVTVGPLTKLWRRARRQEQMPDAALLADARERVGFQKLVLRELKPEDRTATRAGTVELLRPEMRLDFGGIAKGYGVDEALKTLREFGITRALVDGSGDIAIGDPPPGQAGWTIEVAALKTDDDSPVELLLSNCAVATSGDAYQHLQIDGRRYSHIVDPRTGLGVEGASSVTVVAPTGMMADAIASAVSVLGTESGIRFVESDRQPGVEALVMTADRDVIRHTMSSGFRTLIHRR